MEFLLIKNMAWNPSSKLESSLPSLDKWIPPASMHSPPEFHPNLPSAPFGRLINLDLLLYCLRALECCHKLMTRSEKARLGYTGQSSAQEYERRWHGTAPMGVASWRVCRFELGRFKLLHQIHLPDADSLPIDGVLHDGFVCSFASESLHIELGLSIVRSSCRQ